MPTAQSVQVDADWAAVAAEYLPWVQLVQLEALPTAKVATEQLVQAERPMAAE